jgi:hypothetical protein
MITTGLEGDVVPIDWPPKSIADVETFTMNEVPPLAKLAATDRERSIVTVHGAMPVQAPLHPANAEPGAAAG